MLFGEANAVCQMCHAPYRAKPSLLHESRYCSRACADKARRVNNAVRRSVIDKTELSKMYYDNRLSMQQIADFLECNVTTVNYWMNQYGFERRSWSEATYVYRNPDGDPFQIKYPEKESEWALYGVGIGIYMGEGGKNRWSVIVTNTHPGIHRAFIRFLEEICGVLKEDLRADLNIHNDCDVQEAMLWWTKELGITLDQFTKPHVREARKEGTYLHKAVHGTIAIRFDNTKLKSIIEDWCNRYYE